jgi:hypothetical protein
MSLRAYELLTVQPRGAGYRTGCWFVASTSAADVPKPPTPDRRIDHTAVRRTDCPKRAHAARRTSNTETRPLEIGRYECLASRHG